MWDIYSTSTDLDKGLIKNQVFCLMIYNLSSKGPYCGVTLFSFFSFIHNYFLKGLSKSITLKAKIHLPLSLHCTWAKELQTK